MTSGRRRESGQPDTWVFVLALGLLIGFVTGFVTLLSRLPVDPGLASLRTIEVADAPDAASDYEFYTVLADQRVVRSAPAPIEEPASSIPLTAVRAVVPPATRVVPASAQRVDGHALAAVHADDVPASGTGRESYFLQAGSFRDADDAARARAAVLLLGLDAFVVPRRDSDGAIGHRVRIGPFLDAERLADARRRLSGEGIAYDLIRVSG